MSGPKTKLPAGVRVVHVVYDEILGAVVDSQVIETLALLADRGVSVELSAFISPRVLISLKLRRAHKERLMRLRRRLPGVPIRFMVHMPRHRANFVSSRRLRKMVAPKGVESGGTIFHCRGLFAAGVAARLRSSIEKFALIYDQRGDIVAETELVKRKGRPSKSANLTRAARRFHKAESRVLAGVDRVLAVTEALARHDVEAYGFDRNRIRVQASTVDVGRFSPPDAMLKAEVRAELGIESGARVLAYSGSSATWQAPAAVAELTARAHQRRPDTRLLLLSRDAAPFLKACRTAGAPESMIVVKEAPFDLVPRYLAAADAGLLLRESNPVNAVASPVKGGEYLAMGLPLVLTRGIGDLSARVEESGVGVVLDDLDSSAYDSGLDRLETLLAGNSADLARRAANLAGKHQSLSASIGALIRDYEQLAAGWNTSARAAI